MKFFAYRSICMFRNYPKRPEMVEPLGLEQDSSQSSRAWLARLSSNIYQFWAIGSAQLDHFKVLSHLARLSSVIFKIWAKGSARLGSFKKSSCVLRWANLKISWNDDKYNTKYHYFGFNWCHSLLNVLIFSIFDWFSKPAQPEGLENSSLWLGSININDEPLGSARLEKYQTWALGLSSARVISNLSF